MVLFCPLFLSSFFCCLFSSSLFFFSLLDLTRHLILFIIFFSTSFPSSLAHRCGKSVCHPLNGLMCDASTSACSFPACDATDGTKICSCGTTSSTSSSSVCTSNTGYVCAATTGTCSFPACAGTETTGKCECGMSTCGSDTGFRCNAATSTCSFPLCTNIYGILPINDVDGGPECLCTSEREDDEGASCITHDGTYNQHRYNPYCRIQAVGNSKCSTFRKKF